MGWISFNFFCVFLMFNNVIRIENIVKGGIFLAYDIIFVALVLKQRYGQNARAELPSFFYAYCL